MLKVELYFCINALNQRYTYSRYIFFDFITDFIYFQIITLQSYQYVVLQLFHLQLLFLRHP